MLFLLAQVGFLVWAIAHDWRSIDYWRDEQLAEEYIALLRAEGVEP